MAGSYAPFDWYETPLYYDIVFDTDTVREASFLEAIYREYAPSARAPGKLLEPGCGSARLVAAMAQRGFDVVGFDLSDGMLAFARERIAAAGVSSRASVTRAAMQDFRVLAPRRGGARRRGEARGFDMAYCLVSTFKYLLTEQDARSHLVHVAEALRPGGIYVLGFHLTDYDDRRGGRERWVARRDRIDVSCVIEDGPPDRKRRRERYRCRLTVRQAGSTKRYETHWSFRTYDARQFRRLLASVPELQLVATYDFDYDARRRIEFGKVQLDQIVILEKS